MSERAELRIEWEWLPAPTVKAPELRATWARTEIHVGNESVTLVEDQESRSARRGIYCPLYPLAEWIAYNWWFLQADFRPASTSMRLGIRSRLPLSPRHYQRHNFRAAGDGFLWPSLFVLPQGETTQLIWQADPAPGADRPVHFLSSGQSTVERHEVTARLADVVESVLARLHEAGIRQTPLSDEWAAVQGADGEEEAFCLASARLGLDPYSEADKYADEILRAATVLPDDLLGDFLDAVDPPSISADLEWIKAARENIERLPEVASPVTDLRREQAPPSDWSVLRPWEIGWEQARLIRAHAGVRPDQTFEVEETISNTTHPTADRGLQAFGSARRGRSPSVVLSRASTDSAKRFALARAAWHVLWQDAPDFLVTSAYTDKQKVERAFAAELLAPATGIAERLGADPTTTGLEEIEDVARHFRVSSMIVQHQIENQLIDSW